MGAEGMDQVLRQSPLLTLLCTRQELAVARLGVEAVAVVDTELGQNLFMAPVPVVERQRCGDRFEVQVVARPRPRARG